MKKLFVLFVLITVFFVACKKKQEVKDMEVIEPQKSETVTEQKVETVKDDQLSEGMIDESALENNEPQIDKIEQWNKEEILEDIYFGFDKSNLTSESRDVLAKHAAWLKEHTDVKLIIEGHCDERGTEQYNMALGDRRANSVKNYLISLGISSNRLRTQSLGEMFPKVKEHNEWAWSQNRRAHFVIKKID